MKQSGFLRAVWDGLHKLSETGLHGDEDEGMISDATPSSSHLFRKGESQDDASGIAGTISGPFRNCSSRSNNGLNCLFFQKLNNRAHHEIGSSPLKSPHRPGSVSGRIPAEWPCASCAHVLGPFSHGTRAVKAAEMKMPSAAIARKSHMQRNLQTASGASGPAQPHLASKVVCCQFRDRAVAQEAEGVEKAKR
jgi:hypothetical protein